MSRTRTVAGAVTLATVAVVACGGNSKDGHSIRISASTFHGTWPFTVQSGVRTRDQPPVTGAVAFTAYGGAYGINGTALDSGYLDIKPVWRKATHPLLPRYRFSVGDVEDPGLGLCGPGGT